MENKCKQEKEALGSRVNSLKINKDCNLRVFIFLLATGFNDLISSYYLIRNQLSGIPKAAAFNFNIFRYRLKNNTAAQAPSPKSPVLQETHLYFTISNIQLQYKQKITYCLASYLRIFASKLMYKVKC